ncbi:MAG: hypothetical protein RIM23_13645 [Coleofasciculus sp. G3-WIS-01]|uniref:hypothetical protein n=1 Tax=Coleofasciculus sp. G3-WIS-01 TaxID=3069528 RepID=UPI0032FD0DE2
MRVRQSWRRLIPVPGIPEKLFIYRNMENEGDLITLKQSGVPEAAGSKHRNATNISVLDRLYGAAVYSE